MRWLSNNKVTVESPEGFDKNTWCWCKQDFVVFPGILGQRSILKLLIWYDIIIVTIVAWIAYNFTPTNSSIRSASRNFVGNDFGKCSIGTATFLGHCHVLLCTGWFWECLTATWALVASIRLWHSLTKKSSWTCVELLSSIFRCCAIFFQLKRCKLSGLVDPALYNKKFFPRGISTWHLPVKNIWVKFEMAKSGKGKSGNRAARRAPAGGGTQSIANKNSQSKISIIFW